MPSSAKTIDELESAVIEDRGPVGTEFAPLQAGLRTGSSFHWGDFNLGVTQLYVRQDLLNHHFQYTFGKVFAPNYVNPYPLLTTIGSISIRCIRRA